MSSPESNHIPKSNEVMLSQEQPYVLETLHLEKDEYADIESSQIKINIGRSELWLLDPEAPENQNQLEDILSKLKPEDQPKMIVVDFDHLDLKRNLGFSKIYEDDLVLIGRDLDDLPYGLEHLAHDRSISRKHLKLWLHEDKVFIGDRGSTNGTEVTFAKQQET